MPGTSPLPVAPGPDDFRALARSSPWRFGTLHFTHRADGEDPVEAWLTRPGHLVNTLTPFVGDPNVETPEFKAFLVDIQKA